MSIAQNFPNLKPTLLLDFSNTEELDSRVTFTRASTATYYGTQTAKAEENLLLQSQDFATTWGVARTTVTANTVAAPDGATTADTLTNTTATGVHQVNQGGLSIVSGLTYTASVFAKKNTNDFFQITGGGTALGNGRANFDLNTGVLGSVDAGVTASITSIGSGWYRCTYTITAGSSGTANLYFAIITSSTAGVFESYTGLGTESIYLWGAQLEQRSAVTAYTPTTTQPITNYIPQLLTAASGVARFDHNPTTFESLGLLIEDSRTNTYTNSNIPTSLPGAEITLSTAFPALDPTQTFTLGQETTATAEHYFPDRSFIPVVGTTYAFSVYAKQGPGTRNLHLRTASGNVGGSTFNLQTGVVVNNSGVISSATITPVGNGVYRCTAIWTATSATSTVVRLQLITSAGVTIYAGDGYSGISVWGAQLEAGAFATSYIPTVASQVTRAADTPTITGTNFSSWYNNAQGTLYSEASTYDLSSSGRTGFSVNDGTTANRMLTAHGTVKAFIAKSGTTQYTNSLGGVTVTNNVASRVALAYASNNVNAAVNGVIGGVDDTVVELPVVTQSNIGSIAGASSSVNGTIRKIAYYPIRLTNAQLQALTS